MITFIVYLWIPILAIIVCYYWASWGNDELKLSLR